MRKPKIVAPILAAAVFASASVSFAEAPAKRFAHPDRIRYDGQCLTIDGQDTFIFSGAFHYFRTPKALWRERFQKIKDAHFNAVETYVPWNWCERDMPAGLDDFSKTDLTDLKDWLKMAQDEFGLYTIVRPGPYICAEWRGGGFPEWLWSKQPHPVDGKDWIRSDDPTFLAWSKHWYDQVIPVIAAEQITRKPKGSKGVILVQIENEYDYWGGASPAQKKKHLQFLYNTATADGIDVPIFTCWTREARGSNDPILSQVFDSSNFYHRWGLNATSSASLELRAKQPDAPTMVTELQGGWFAEAGGQLSEDQGGIEPQQTNGITLTAIANNATLLNYYMLVGGSNFGAWGSNEILQTYDYNAPIRENGGGGEKYEVVKALGAFLAEHGRDLVRSQLTPIEMQKDPNLVVTVRTTTDGAHLVFCRNTTGDAYHAKFNAKLPDGITLSIDRQLPAKLTEVLFLPSGKTASADGTWWCEPAAVPERPQVSPPVRVATALTREDPGPTHWQPIPRGASLIGAGLFSTDDVVYRSKLTLSAEQVGKFTTLKVKGGEAGRLMLQANVQVIKPRSTGDGVTFAVGGALRAGENEFGLLYENHGITGFGGGLNWQPGVRVVSLLQQGSAGRPLEAWRVSLLKEGQKPAVSPDVDDSAWDKVVLNDATFSELAAAKQPGHPPLTYPAAAILNGKAATAVYRTAINLSDKEVAAKPVMLDLQRIDDNGEIYVNGQHVGSSHSWRTPFLADVSSFVHAGNNTIAVVVTNIDHDGGLTMPAQIYSEEDVVTLDTDLGTLFTGVAQQWWQASGGNEWKSVALDTTSPLAIRREKSGNEGKPQTLARWFRTEFELPDPQAGVWAPWNAIINASGNGFLYLNGHELGRFYDSGPQRQFYLPECWLKTGRGQKNVLAMVLHPASGDALLKALEIRQSQAQAERR